MKTKCLAPWFGSKRTLAPQIVAALGEHNAYWEVLLVNQPAGQAGLFE